MRPERKRVKVLSQRRKDGKDAKKKAASDGRSKARKRFEEVRNLKTEREARRKELQESLAGASEEDAKAMQADIDAIMIDIQDAEEKLQAAQAEEARFKKDEEDAEMEDEYSEEEEDGNTQDKPLQTSIESIDPAEYAAKIMEGLSIADGDEGIDLTQDIQLRNTQAVVCYKSGFGKPVIVVDVEFRDFPIYRIRKDIMVRDGTPNLMRWRRGGKFKDVKAEVKWSSSDIKAIIGIAIEVPLGYEGKPEDLVRPIRRLSKEEKDALIKKGKPVPKEPKQPDVQLVVEWKKGVIAEGETKERCISFESRSSCRNIWRKKGVADTFLWDVAKKKEAGYRKAGGRHSSEERSLSPIRIPSAGSTPGPEDKPDGEGSGTEDEEEREKKKKEEEKKKEEKKEEEKKREEEAEKKKKEEEEEKKREEEKRKGGASAYKTNLKAFEEKFRMLEDIDADAKLTAAQKGEMIEAFDAYWKKQAK